MRVSFRGRLAATLAILAAAGGPIATAGDDLIACREDGHIVVRKDGWTQINPPKMVDAEGPRSFVDFVAAPQLRNVVFMTNGSVIKFSSDGGCTWNFLQQKSNIQAPGGQHQADIFSHLAAPNVAQLWAASVDSAGDNLWRPHVHLFQKESPSDKGYAAHSMVENGLPAFGRPLALLGASGATTAMYILIEEPPDPRSGSLDATHHLYTTVVPNNPPELSVIGTIWQEVDAPEDFGRIEGVAVMPFGRGLWIWSKTKLALTTEADAETVAWDVETLDVERIAGVDVDSLGTALVAVETAQGGHGALLFDNKLNKAGDVTIPLVPTSMAHGSVPRSRVISGKEGTWGFDAYHRKWIDITPKGVGPLASLQFASGRSNRIVLGHTKDAIFRYDLFSGESFLPGAAPLDDETWPDVPHGTITRPALIPERQVVTVQPGQVKDAPVRFEMPPAVNPLDVYFLVDTTSSMQNAINSLKADIKDIAEGIRRRLGRDACFGVGDFKDFDSAGALDADKVFRTHLKITCEEDRSLPRVTAALNMLQQGGGGDNPEAHTVALEEMLTGIGRATPPVLPNQDAEFRPEAYKVVVLITDVEFKQGNGYPTIEAVGKKLEASAVKVVSVLVQNRHDLATARVHTGELAQRTNSMAPPGGVDCDGDPKTSDYDVAAGGPLVCERHGDNVNIGPVIVRLLLGVEDPGTVAVNIDDPHRVIRGRIKGRTSKITDLKRESSLPFKVPVGCTPAQDGLDLTVGLTPTVRAASVGDLHGEIIVRCRAVVLPVDPPRPPPPPIEPEPIIPAPPRAPIAIALAPPPNPPVQPISNINLNAGFSQQEEQQFQLATVTQGAGDQQQEDEEVELAMVGLGQDTSATPVAAFLAGATLLSAAAAVAHRRRLQRTTRSVHARIR